MTKHRSSPFFPRSIAKYYEQNLDCATSEKPRGVRMISESQLHLRREFPDRSFRRPSYRPPAVVCRELRPARSATRTKTNICPTVMRYIFRCKQRRYDSNSCRKRRVSRERVRRKINVLANSRPVNKRMRRVDAEDRVHVDERSRRAVELIC